MLTAQFLGSYGDALVMLSHANKLLRPLLSRTRLLHPYLSLAKSSQEIDVPDARCPQFSNSLAITRDLRLVQPARP